MPTLRLSLLPLVVACAAVCAPPAQASTLTYGGTTVGAPTVHRPDTLSTLSFGATAVPYDSFSFVVTGAGTYNFLSIGFPTWDNYLLLYQGRFIAELPLVNLLALNDDYLGIGVSRIDIALNTNTSYVLVTSGYRNSSEGTYANSITGPAAVTPLPNLFDNAVPAPVPEPMTGVLMSLGLGAFWVARRRLPPVR